MSGRRHGNTNPVGQRNSNVHKSKLLHETRRDLSGPMNKKKH
uniref:Uncharacterized protein n=1 Tax=Brassica campestris TaxID=3711 RepID=A0A3P5Z4C2_BRACM|nr:unnamed protein product [Brassica rapa]